MLELKDINYTVTEESGEQKTIIDGLNLEIEDGRFVVITGPNGGGKSTLAKVIMGINKVSEGQIILDGEDITADSITERANKGISFAFQQPVHFKGICFDLYMFIFIFSFDFYSMLNFSYLDS